MVTPMGFRRNTPNMRYGHAQRDAAPCMGCTDRAVGCHGICEKYKAWQAVGAENWKKFVTAYNAERAVEQFEAHSKERTLKRQHRWNGR